LTNIKDIRKEMPLAFLLTNASGIRKAILQSRIALTFKEIFCKKSLKNKEK
jgi:hypothetical protein